MITLENLRNTMACSVKLFCQVTLILLLAACSKSSSNGSSSGGNSGSNSNNGGGSNKVQDSSTITIVNETITAVYFKPSNGDSVLVSSLPIIFQTEGETGFNGQKDSTGTVTYKGVVGTTFAGIANTNLSVPFPDPPFYSTLYRSLPGLPLLGSVVSWNINLQFSANPDTFYLIVPNTYYLLLIDHSYTTAGSPGGNFVIDTIYLNWNTPNQTLLKIPGGIPPSNQADTAFQYVVGYFPIPSQSDPLSFYVSAIFSSGIYDPGLYGVQPPFLQNGVMELQYTSVTDFGFYYTYQN
jgi:hypothetical protein